MIAIDDFAKLELKVGTILGAEEIEGSDKLLKLKVDLGEESPRQIIAGIKNYYKKEELVNNQIVVVANLEPRQMMGMESQGMVLATDSDTGPILLIPEKEVPPGSKIR